MAKTMIRFNGNVSKVNYLCSSFCCAGDKEKLYVIGNEFGSTDLIVANNETEAWEEWLDNQPALDDDDLFIAYGFDNPDQYKLACGLDDDARSVYLKSLGLSEDFTIIEGYEYMPNSGNTTGIVDVSEYIWIRKYVNQKL